MNGADGCKYEARGQVLLSDLREHGRAEITKQDLTPRVTPPGYRSTRCVTTKRWPSAVTSYSGL
jgi:hypothetical protein